MIQRYFIINYAQGKVTLKTLDNAYKFSVNMAFKCFSFSYSVYYSVQVPERVRAMNASIKLLLIVREPVTRAISDYTQLRSHAATATLPLADAVPPLTQATDTNREGRAAIKSQPKSRLSSLLYGKSNAYSSAQVYDNSLGGGGGGGLVAGFEASSGGSGEGGPQHSLAYTTTPAGAFASATAQIAAKLVFIHKMTENYAASYAYSGKSGGFKIETSKQNFTFMFFIAKFFPFHLRSFEELAIFPNGTVNESYRPLTISMYHLHLHRWLEAFPREQLLVK